jgi:hypothetical protein
LYPQFQLLGENVIEPSTVHQAVVSRGDKETEKKWQPVPVLQLALGIICA